MKTLDQIQNNFYTALRQKSPKFLDFIASNHPSQRLNTYRQSVNDALGNALALTFPGTWILLGNECANALAAAFCSTENHLPTTACLDDWGAEFPDFIGQQSALDHLPYLKDYANYEWLKHLSSCAHDLPTLAQNKLTTISEDSLENLVFSFHPSVFIFNSDFPLNKIEALTQNPNTESFELKHQNTYALITRHNNTVITDWISSEQFLFISHLKQKLTLSQALQKTLAKAPHLNLKNLLYFLFTKKLMTSITKKIETEKSITRNF